MLNGEDAVCRKGLKWFQKHFRGIVTIDWDISQKRLNQKNWPDTKIRSSCRSKSPRRHKTEPFIVTNAVLQWSDKLGVLADIVAGEDMVKSLSFALKCIDSLQLRRVRTYFDVR